MVLRFPAPSNARRTLTDPTRPGSKESERRLTPDGERHALEVGDYLRTQGITVDTVVCSSAARARQTLELLKLDDQLDPDRVEIADRYLQRGHRYLDQRRTRASRGLPRCPARRPRPRCTRSGVRTDRQDDFHTGGSQCDRGPLSGCCAGPTGVRRATGWRATQAVWCLSGCPTLPAADSSRPNRLLAPAGVTSQAPTRRK